jgi:hypothetical protein
MRGWRVIDNKHIEYHDGNLTMKELTEFLDSMFPGKSNSFKRRITVTYFYQSKFFNYYSRYTD